MTAPRLSVVVITLNEEDRIRETLTSVAWADEIVVIDAGSEDKTVALAREFTDHVMIHAWQGFAAQSLTSLARVDPGCAAQLKRPACTAPL